MDYRRLNIIIIRNYYLIPLIKEALAYIVGYKYLTKLNIITIFNKLRIYLDSKDYTTFTTSFGAFKYYILPFGLIGGPTSY